MSITRKFRIDVYDCTVYIKVCNDIKKSVNHILRVNKLDTLEIAPRGFFFRSAEDTSNYWVFFDTQWLDVDTVNHEKSHLVEEILRDRGIRASGEVRAYLDGFVSKKFSELFTKAHLTVEP